ncbi:MAG TPA: hypothetical protein VLY23_04760 [Candidatus Acidoferrum sp.]|nr:hypothetical protein [Candidatus Acidoferrum sp.]
MGDVPKSKDVGANPEQPPLDAAAVNTSRPDLRDPRVVLSLLEADQVVAAKKQTHFGKRELSVGIRALLWGLRIYVVVMLIIVLISVLRVFHSAP